MDNEKLELQGEPESKDIWTPDPERYRPPNLPDDHLYAGQLSESQTPRQIYESEVVVR